MMCFQSVFTYTICFRSGYTHMRHDEVALLSEEGRGQARELGSKLARLRAARKLRQADAAVKAGLSRSTAALIEAGDPRRTLAQVLRYLEAIAPHLTLLDLLQETDPSLKALAESEVTRRVRLLSKAELQKLDF